MSNVRQTALQVMRRVEHGAFSNAALSSALSKENYSAQDKGFLTDLVYGCLRKQDYLDWCLAPLLKRPDKFPEDVRNILRLASYELLERGTAPHAAVNEWVNLTKKKYKPMSNMVNAVLRKVEAIDGPLHTRYSIPKELFQDWKDLFTKPTAIEIAKALNEPATLWLNVYKPEAEASLVAQGCEIQTRVFENCWQVQSPIALNELEAFKKGYLQAQNPSSVFVGELLAVEAGERILDLCSGNGIKAAQLAAKGANVVSVEVGAKKLERAEQNLTRLGLKATSVVANLTQVPKNLEPTQKVLLDAPCSGTGTVRSNPEIKLRLTEEDVSNLVDLQKQLLKTAAQLTQANGTLLYAVCAISKAEGIDIIEDFLANNQDFSIEPLTLEISHSNHDFGSYILPFNGFDGFFIAKLNKTSV